MSLNQKKTIPFTLTSLELDLKKISYLFFCHKYNMFPIQQQLVIRLKFLFACNCQWFSDI